MKLENLEAKQYKFNINRGNGIILNFTLDQIEDTEYKLVFCDGMQMNSAFKLIDILLMCQFIFESIINVNTILIPYYVGVTENKFCVRRSKTNDIKDYIESVKDQLFIALKY